MSTTVDTKKLMLVSLLLDDNEINQLYKEGSGPFGKAQKKRLSLSRPYQFWHVHSRLVRSLRRPLPEEISYPPSLPAHILFVLWILAAPRNRKLLKRNAS